MSDVTPRHLADDPRGLDEDDDFVTHAVRPYAITGGRTRSSRPHLPVEALVQALVRPGAVSTTPERHRIIELTHEQYLSVAELSAHLEVPVGVVRVLLGDLVDEQLVRVHGASPTTAPATSLSVLESVLDGISAL